jgi:hypothetical protein
MKEEEEKKMEGELIGRNKGKHEKGRQCKIGNE